MKLIKKIKQIDRHRNGVHGAPFYAVLFEQKEERGLMLGIVFDEPAHCAVVAVDPLSTDVGVTFSQNSWRGDNYEPELRQAILEYEDSQLVKS